MLRDRLRVPLRRQRIPVPLLGWSIALELTDTFETPRLETLDFYRKNWQSRTLVVLQEHYQCRRYGW